MPFVDQRAANPQSWNLYVYARNSPLLYVDPNGTAGILSTVLKGLRKKAAFETARSEGVRRAWQQERKKVIQTGGGTREWTEREIKELVETGQIRGYFGHHINSVASNSEAMARNPNNVQFLNFKEHLAKHEGNFRNQTSGDLLSRISILSGPALLAFFTVYDQKVKQFTSDEECPMCSNSDSWTSLINPWNNMLEGPALLEALTAAGKVQEQHSGWLSDEQAESNAIRECEETGSYGGNEVACKTR